MRWLFRFLKRRAQVPDTLSGPASIPRSVARPTGDWARLGAVPLTFSPRPPTMTPVRRVPRIPGTASLIKRPVESTRPAHSEIHVRVDGLTATKRQSLIHPDMAGGRDAADAAPPAPTTGPSVIRPMRVVPVSDDIVEPRILTQASDEYVGAPQVPAMPASSTTAFERFIEDYLGDPSSEGSATWSAGLIGFSPTSDGFSSVATLPESGEPEIPPSVPSRSFRRPTLAQSRRMGLHGIPDDLVGETAFTRPVVGDDTPRSDDIATVRSPLSDQPPPALEGHPLGFAVQADFEEQVPSAIQSTASSDDDSSVPPADSAQHDNSTSGLFERSTAVEVTKAADERERQGPEASLEPTVMPRPSDAAITPHVPRRLGLGAPLRHRPGGPTAGSPPDAMVPTTGQAEAARMTSTAGTHLPHDDMRLPEMTPLMPREFAGREANQPEPTAAMTLRGDGGPSAPDTADRTPAVDDSPLIHPPKPSPASSPSPADSGVEKPPESRTGVGVSESSPADGPPSDPKRHTDEQRSPDTGSVRTIYRATIGLPPPSVTTVSIVDEPGAWQVASPMTQVAGDITSAFRTHFGVDLGQVTVHRGPEISARARSLSARAYAQHGDVFLPSEAGDVDDRDTRALLAHELVHAAQQRILGSDLPDEGSADGQELEASAQATEQWFRGERSAPLPLIHFPHERFRVRTEPRSERQSDESPGFAWSSGVAPAAATQRAEMARAAEAFSAERMDLNSVSTVSPSTGEPAAAGPPVFHESVDSSRPGPELPGAGVFDRVVDSRFAEPEMSDRGSAVVDGIRARLDRIDEVLAAMGTQTSADLDTDDRRTLDGLAENLYRHVRSRLRAELLIDRERAGILTDFR